jgi:tripartite-type tricarboxylate transporter receptor subunit TctC
MMRCTQAKAVSTQRAAPFRSAVAVVAVMALCGSSAAIAQTPGAPREVAAPLRLVSPDFAQTATGQMASALAAALQNVDRRTVRVDTVPGDSGVAAARAVAAAPADGATALFLTGLGPAVPQRLVPVAMVAQGGIGLYQRVGVAQQGFRGLRTVVGIDGGPAHQVASVLARRYDFDSTFVADGEVSAIEAAVQQGAALLMPPLGSNGQIPRMNLLAVSDARVARRLEKPSFADMGWPLASATLWAGVFVAPNTPPELRSALAVALRRAAVEPSFVLTVELLNWMAMAGSGDSLTVVMQEAGATLRGNEPPAYQRVVEKTEREGPGAPGPAAATVATTSTLPIPTTSPGSTIPTPNALPLTTATTIATASTVAPTPATAAPLAATGAAVSVAFGPADVQVCLPQIRYLRSFVNEVWAGLERDQCTRPEDLKEIEECDFDPRTRRYVNCVKRQSACDGWRKAAAEDRALSDLEWYWRGNSTCANSGFPCYGPYDLSASGSPQSPADVLAWYEEDAKLPLPDVRRMPRAPSLRARSDMPHEMLRDAEVPVRVCVARAFVAKHAVTLAAQQRAQPGARGGSAPTAAAETPPMSNFQCEQTIMAVHRESRDAVQAARSAAESDVANAQMARRQRALFQGPCRRHPEAAAYLATAERILASSRAFAEADPAATAAQSAAGAVGSAGSTVAGSALKPGGERPRGEVIASAGEPAHACLSPLMTGLYGGFANSCGYKVNYTYCVANPKEGSWTDAAFFRCDSAENTREGNGYLSIGPLKSDANHTRGGTQVHWFACKHPAVPYRHRFTGGKIMGICLL